ncbi:peptide chain release factor N(5)-glutamine methyltransferase [Robertkochia solimangrovi]|uniref:peptide chain release factor N(5)-glutamine methyltransferase n=1 Tax=Robertkochia solimangrovi TaxID=2213046 RepID=UPI00117F49D4|nr:peptide chain release factor N(5)-glutamine methyltransferase [Robertkochia solimangrovi]TRZ41066.1 peptide chain release factor N(5)-glutamine methyltransferase [Robertkochia solimangrovi]
MKLNALRNYARQRLTPVYGEQETQSMFKILCETFLMLEPYQITMNLDKEIDEEALNRFEDAIEKLYAQQPVQYIVGETTFRGLPLKVNGATLIPRPETEELVAWIIKDHEKHTGVKFLDIGTGSGCIALSISDAMSKAVVVAVDISEEALATARENAINNHLGVGFKRLDILNIEHLANAFGKDPVHFDCIVSNPPYVRMLERKDMKPNVLNYEPATALFVSDEDPLLFYRKISALAYENLNDGGSLYFEINEYLPEETSDLVRGAGFREVSLKKDLFGKYRMLKAIK